MNSDHFSDKQQKVFDAAKAQLEQKPWFRGVCCNDFPSDNSIDENFDDAVNSVLFETAMWDDPEFFNH